MNSPSLTQTQLDAYGGNHSSDNYNGSNGGYNPQGLSPSRSLHRNGSSQNGNVFDPRGESRSGNHSQNQQQQNQQGLAPSQPGSTQSPYQTLHVQANQIASRSTPKLTLFAQPVSQSHYTNESKETRSFNGLPGQLDPKPKPKSSRLKPIIPVEKADDEHVERYVLLLYVTVVSFFVNQTNTGATMNPIPTKSRSILFLLLSPITSLSLFLIAL
jgi:hypothetical protein